MRKVLALLVTILAASIVIHALPLTVLYTNDLHVRLSRLESMEAMIKAERALGDPVLLFDAGDTWQDFRLPLPAVWGAAEMVAWMNRVGYAAMAVGNHDFYLGEPRLAELIGETLFPVLCANYMPKDAERRLLVPSTILDVEGTRVLVVGLTVRELLPFGALPDYRLLDSEDVIRHEMEIHSGRYDFLFAVGHTPVKEAIRLAMQLPEIDVFITGHSHERTPKPIVQGSTIIVQSGQFAEHLGRLRLDLDPEQQLVRVVDNTLLATEATPVDVRSGVAQILLTAISILGIAALLFF